MYARTLVLAAAIALVAAPAFAIQRLWLAGSNMGGTSSLAEVTFFRSDSPVVVVSGDSGVRLADIAVDPTTGTIYGVDDLADLLYTVDPADASVTIVGTSGESTCNFVALDFDPTGQLWGWCSGLNRLYQIDKTTGAATTFATTGILVASGDLAFDCEGNLWATSTSDELIRFDIDSFGSGAMSGVIIGDLNLPNGSPFGLEIDFNGDIIVGEGNIGGNALARLWNANPETAQLSLRADLTDANVGLFGLAFTLTPSTVFEDGFEDDDLEAWDSQVP